MTRLTTTILLAIFLAATTRCAPVLAAANLAAPPDADPSTLRAPVPLTAASRAAIVDSVAAALQTDYIYAETATKMCELIRGKQARGEYDGVATASDFADQLTHDLQSVSQDKHLRVMPVSPAEAARPAPMPAAEREKRMAEDAAAANYGFQKVEHLEGNVGYLDLRSFFDAKYAGETAVAAMNLLGHSDALIFDLRKNGGGWPSMIQLLSSYLFDQPTHLNTFYIRKTNETDQFWTQASVPGPRLSHVPVYVLTSGYTFSGAEEFTYNLKNLKRATIIGEVTGGGAHPVDLYTFAGLPVSLNLPTGRAINPITGTNWEGTGVTPDIAVPADEALAVAHGEALKAILHATDDPGKKQRAQWTLDGLEMKAKPVTLSPKELQAYVGAYGARHVSVKDGLLYYQREGGPVRRLVPAAKDIFLLDGFDAFRAQFTRDAKGRVEKFVGLYDDGHTDEAMRSGS